MEHEPKWLGNPRGEVADTVILDRIVVSRLIHSSFIGVSFSSVQKAMIAILLLYILRSITSPAILCLSLDMQGSSMLIKYSILF